MFKSKSILNSILLTLLFLEIVYSSNFNIATSKNEFKPSTELYSFYTQKNKNNEAGGYHKAEVYFKTKVPSINPDQSGVKSINCNDGNKITLNLGDENAVKNVENWPDTVMLLVSHKWKCFNKKSTQFFMSKNKSIDVPNKKVTFITESCEISDWAEDFSIDLAWVEGKSNRTKRINNRSDLNKRFSVDKNGKLSLNVLFDEATGGSTKPDVPLFSNSEIAVSCTNCFMKGEATLSVKFDGGFGSKGIKLKESKITVGGNALMNLDLLMSGTFSKTFSFDNTLLTVPLTGFPNVPGLFSLGPSIDLIVSTKLSAEIEGSIGFGGDVNLPDFTATADFVDITQPKFDQSGFKPESNLHEPLFNVTGASASLTSSIIPQLTFGIDILDGKFQRQVGFEIVGSLDNNVSIGNKAECEKNTQPRLKTSLNGNLGFFINDADFPVVEFPTITLFDKCL
jgi:hypothetical protein